MKLLVKVFLLALIPAYPIVGRAWLAQRLAQERNPLFNANHQLALDEINNWYDRGTSESPLAAPLSPGAPI